MDPQHISDRTVVGLFARRVASSPTAAALRHHDGSGWRTLSYADFQERVLRVAARLVEQNIEAGDRVAILSHNSLEWQVCDLAIQFAGAVTVPVYPTLPDRDAVRILDHSGSRLVFVSDERDADRVAPFRAVRMDSEVGGWMSTEASGDRTAQVERRAEAIQPDDLCTIVYTSGTTGL
ncbi:MAG: AMP-binding protein, partial [Candidatus Dormibacteraeota bacterium]|nr:AMP-binding protein [Candidatus Dormibacteraeota bacterium]